MITPNEGKRTGLRSRGIRPALWSFFALVAVLAGSVCLVLLSFNSPSAVNRLSAMLEPVTGYRVHVDDVSLSAALAGEIDNLRITKRGEGTPLASFTRVEFKATPRLTTGAIVEKMVLDHPRFRFVLKRDKKETDWSGLDKLPPVRFLQIKEGEIDISGADYRILATHLNATIDNFSPRAGGRARLMSVLAVSGNGEATKQADKLNGDGTVSADIQLARLFPKMAGKGKLAVKLKSGALAGLSFKDVVLDAPLSLDSERLAFEKTTLRLGSFEYKANGGGRGVLKDMVLNGSGLFERRSSVLTVGNISGNVPDAGEFAGSGAVKLSGDFPWKASFSATSVNFARVFALMNPLLPDDYRKWGIQGRGDLAAELENRWTNDTGINGTIRLRMLDAGFTSADKTKAGANLAGEIVLKLAPRSARKNSFTGRVEMNGGEFLWGAYYKDFKNQKMSLSSEGRFSFGPNAFLDCSGEVDFYQAGDCTYRASLERGSSTFGITARNVSNNRVYTLLFKDYFGDDSALSGLEVTGASDIDLSLSRNGDGETAITGRMKMVGGSLSLPESKIALANLNIDLPFDLSFNDRADEDKGRQETGFIKLKRLQRGGIVLENIEIPVATARNRFETLREIDAELFGGRVRVGPVKLQNVLTPSTEVSTRITVEHLNLSTLTRELFGVDLQGSVDADLAEVSFAQGKWTSSGKVRANAFGGVVEARNLSGSDLLAPSRMVGGDVTFAGLDLEQMTNLTKTGKVTGFVRGSITDFSMAYGEPSSFILRLESDTSKSSSRMISVDAIENLSIIGTGSSGISAVLNSGLNRFFKAYPYSRIGIMCTLKNDTFRLRGTIHEGNTEYLIRKGLFRGIDVINQNPDNAISFRDMQERIGRIFKSEKAQVS